jgi:hypothetical protein
MRLIVVIVSALLVALPARADVRSPEGAMHEFYAWVLAHPSSALPSSGQRIRLARFLSPQLIQLLKDAAETQARCVKAAPRGEKPNVMEGDLFVGNYEGATEVAYGIPHPEGGGAVVESDLLYIDARFPKAHRHRAIAWKDRLELQRVEGRWLVNDVKFQQGRSFAAGLNDYITEGARSCVNP